MNILVIKHCLACQQTCHGNMSTQRVMARPFQPAPIAAEPGAKAKAKAKAKVRQAPARAKAVAKGKAKAKLEKVSPKKTGRS